MSSKALTRYRLYQGDIQHDLYPIADSIERSPQDLCLVDDAAREIARLEARVWELEQREAEVIRGRVIP